MTGRVNDVDTSSNKRSNAPVVGGAVGSAIAALSTQIQDQAWRNLITVSAPIIAVSVTAIWGAIVQIIQRMWRDFNQRHATKNATKHYQQLISDPTQPEEVRERAEKAMINAQLATIEYHEKNLNLVSNPTSEAGKKTQRRRAAGNKNAQVQEASNSERVDNQ